MLEDLLRNDSIEEKKKNLSEYDIEITETIEGSVNVMCNLSDIILEKGIEEGMEKGIEKGIEKTLVSLTCRKLKKNKTPETIADELEEDYDKIKSICDIADAFAPDYDVDAICAQMQNAK